MSAQDEFAKVQLERSDDEGTGSDIGNDDDMETILSDMDAIKDNFDEDEIKPRLERSDADDENFGIDAIKYAIYTKWQHEDGTSEWMWRYNVMWTGYLQSGYDQLEGIDSIAETDDPDEDQVRLFWRSFDTSATPFLRLKKGEREPPPPPKKFRDTIFDCPASRMKIWLAETNGLRLYKTFLARRQWEKNHPDELRVPKKVSDYYVWTKNQRRKAKENKKEKKGEKSAGASLAVKTDRDLSKTSSGGKEPIPTASNASKNSVSKAEEERRDRYKQGAPGERPVKDGGSRSPSKGPPHANASAGPSRPQRARSPGGEGLSDFDSLNSLFGSDQEADKPVPAAKSMEAVKKRKLDSDRASSTGETKVKKKKPKSAAASQAPVPLPPPPPTVPVKRLERFEKIKKRTEDDAPYDLSMSEMIRAPTPSFGEPVLGIFDSAPSSAPANLTAFTQIQPPTPAPTCSKSVPARPPPPSAQPPNLLDSVLASLRANQAKQVPARPPSPPPSAVDSNLDPRVRPPPVEAPLPPAPPAPPEPLFTPVTSVPSPTEPKPDLTSRPKYQQPVKMKFIDEPIQPTFKGALSVPRKLSASNIPGPSSLPMRSPRDGMNSPMDSIAGRSPLDLRNMPSPQNPRQSPLHPGQSPLSGGSTPIPPSAQFEQHSASIRTTAGPSQPARHLPPTQPRNFVPPSGAEGYGGRGSGPLPDQPQSYHAAIPPTGPRSAVKAPPTGPSASITQGTDPVVKSFAPRNSENTSRQSSRYDAALDPRAALISPPITQTPQMSLVPSAQYNPTADPRRRAAGTSMPTPSEASSTPLAPKISPRSPGSDNQRLPVVSNTPPRMDPICDFKAYIPLGGVAVDFAVRALPADVQRGTDLICRFLGSSNSSRIAVALEELDGAHLQGTLGLGGRLVQWAKLVQAEEKVPNVARKSDWEVLKAKVDKDRKVYVTYTDHIPNTADNAVSTHCAIVLASPYLFDLSGDDPKGAIGPDSWTIDQIKVGVFIVSLPLSSIPAPRLPNPVRPFFEQPVDVEPPIPPYKVPLLDSFGMDQTFMQTLQDRTVTKYPPSEGPTDDLHEVIISALKQCGARAAGNELTDVMLVMNQKWTKTLKSSTIRSTLSRRTAFYALGPDLRLYPSQWKLTRIWQSGGLVTFSPTFILRSPAKFADIMSMVRTVDTWGAYILPSVMEWCHRSWSEPARCPDPTKAFDALSRSLFLDQHLLRLSGSASAAGGGLAVSCAPPGVHQFEACTKWMDWLRKIDETSEYDKLIDLCLGVAPADFFSLDEVGSEKKESTRKELELVDIERAQLEDLIAMRSRPHLLPYRRYIHVGELSLDQNSRKQYAAELEFATADDFAAIFSGAI